MLQLLARRIFKSGNYPPKLSWQEIFNSNTINFLEFLLEKSPGFAEKYGEIVHLFGKQYLVAGPNAFKYILKTKPENFSKDNRTYHRIKHLFGQGLIVTEGALWEKHRQLLHGFFHKARLDQYAALMIHSTEEWLETCANKEQINLVHEMTRLTLIIAFRCFASMTPTEKEIKAINFAILQGTPHLSHGFLLSPWFPSINNLLFFWSMRHNDRILSNIINTRKRDLDPPEDYLNLLVSLKKQENDLTFSDEEVLDEFKTILFTGHETTACALTWVFYFLDAYPKYRHLVEQEIHEVLGDRPPTLEDCNALPWVRAVFLEALRLYPPIWCLPRKVLTEDTILDSKIPKGSDLILNIHALHRNSNYWENPHQFFPERFLGENTAQKQMYSFLPFSIGKHACIGSQFAMTEGVLLIALIAQRFRLQSMKDHKKISAIPYLSLRPPKHLKMMLCARYD